MKRVFKYFREMSKMTLLHSWWMKIWLLWVMRISEEFCVQYTAWKDKREVENCSPIRYAPIIVKRKNHSNQEWLYISFLIEWIEFCRNVHFLIISYSRFRLSTEICQCLWNCCSYWYTTSKWSEKKLNLLYFSGEIYGVFRLR